MPIGMFKKAMIYVHLFHMQLTYQIFLLLLVHFTEPVRFSRYAVTSSAQNNSFLFPSDFMPIVFLSNCTYLANCMAHYYDCSGFNISLFSVSKQFLVIGFNICE